MENTSYGSLTCQGCQEKYLRCIIIDGKRKWGHRKFCSKCRENQQYKFISKSKISDEEFIKVIKKSLSIHQALLFLGLKSAGGNYQTFHRRVEYLKIDTSHFTGQAHNVNKKFGPKRPTEDYLNNKYLIRSSELKNRLLKEGLKTHQCEKCNLSEWLGLKIPLELHHVNGNSSDNSILNLMLLCPNCHSFTDNYRGKNIKLRVG